MKNSSITVRNITYFRYWLLPRKQTRVRCKNVKLFRGWNILHPIAGSYKKLKKDFVRKITYHQFTKRQYIKQEMET